MIALTKFDGKPIMLNADWIQCVEKTPDTLITLSNGIQLLVKDKLEDVVKAFKAYKKEFIQMPMAKEQMVRT